MSHTYFKISEYNVIVETRKINIEGNIYDSSAIVICYGENNEKLYIQFFEQLIPFEKNYEFPAGNNKEFVMNLHKDKYSWYIETLRFHKNIQVNVIPPNETGGPSISLYTSELLINKSDPILDLVVNNAPFLVFHPKESSQCCFPSNAEYAYELIKKKQFTGKKEPKTLIKDTPCYYQAEINWITLINGHNISRIKYWFWYNFNDYPTDPLDIAGSHEGDWESVEVIFLSGNPFVYLLSSHTTNIPVWPNNANLHNKRIKIWVGNGSHANYPSINSALFKVSKYSDQLADSNIIWDTSNKLVNIKDTNFYKEGFSGLWGEKSQINYRDPPKSPITTDRQFEYKIPYYEIIIHTGDKDNSGTDSKVYIQLFGDKNYKSNKINLDNYENNFERNKTDIFSPGLDNYLGDISKILISHDNSGKKPGWYLKDVEIINKVSNLKKKFNCEKWLAKDVGDKQISRILTAT